jgi:hypothetical protein
MRLFLLFVLPFYLFLLSSCKKYKAADPAFFIRSGNVSVKTSAKEGTGSHKITDLWLYTNGKFQGAYPVGSLLPIVSNDKAVGVNIFAGIKNNGISGTRIFYPFFEILELDTFVESGKTIDRSFVFKYKSTITFAWNETFEGGVAGFGLKKSDISNTGFKIASPGDSFEGRSIEVALTGDSVVAQLQTSSAFALPTGDPDVYLEMNYKCNEQLEVGVIGDDSSTRSAVIVNPQENWNKIYIQLAYLVNSPNF